MSKLYFRYGAMGSSKSANALMVKYNYEERGRRVLLTKPGIDTRNGALRVASRCGLQSACQPLSALYGDLSGVDCVIVDEAQFLTRAQVEQLVHIVDDLGIPVIAYGLRTDFRNELFEGSKYLLSWADTIEEIKTICWCGKKAVCNARFGPDGKLTREGEQILLGANDRYISLCRKHFMTGDPGPAYSRPASALTSTTEEEASL